MRQHNERGLRALVVATSYPENKEDWRGRFIADMIASLSRTDDLALSLWAPPGERPDRVADATLPDEARWLKQMMGQGGIAHVLRSRGLASTAAISRLLLYLRRAYRRNRGVDVVHVNWLQNALPLFGTSTPAVISVLGSDFALLRLPGMKWVLREVFRRRRCLIAPNAGWMSPALTRAFGDVAEIRSIPFGVDQPWFAVTRAAGYPPRWLVISRVTRGKIGTLFDWGGGLFGPERTLHLIGPNQERLPLPEWVDYRGPAGPAELRQKWFPEAAGLITLSRHDEGRPQVVLEAMAAGLPVIASDLPAHRDLILHGQTGWLVSSAQEFASAIAHLGEPEENRRMGEAARAWVRDHIGTWDDCARRYYSAYRTVLGRAP